METQLAALLTKYQILRDLRARREERVRSGRSWSAAEGIARRAAFRALARDFPGALRELDRGPVAVLDDKVAAVAEELAAVRAGAQVGRMWVKVVLDFHATLRRLLAAKAWLARPAGPPPTLSPTELEHVRRPPGGRLVALAWRELERRHRRPRADLEEMVLGAQR